ncbi:MAG: hypothetical protein K6E36_02505 [Oscillospiraceae bacterium]|nr:hypothetical protein [Oscillospiraceae bacterium]
MSKQKLRHWIYLAIFIAIAGAAAWYLLLHDANLTEEKIREELAGRQASYSAVADYLIEKGAAAEITGAVTAGRTYGVPEEDSDAYRAFAGGVRVLTENNCVRIQSTGKAVLFYMKPQGGFLNQEYYILAKNAENATLANNQPNTLNDDGWKYYLAQGKP